MHQNPGRDSSTTNEQAKKPQTQRSFTELELEGMKAFNLTTLINTTKWGLLGRLSSCPSLFSLLRVLVNMKDLNCLSPYGKLVKGIYILV